MHGLDGASCRDGDATGQVEFGLYCCAGFRLVDRLPSSNGLLLRHLAVVLRRICDHSAANEMTAYNLAACIGQCLLWPPSDVRLSCEGHLAAAKRTNQVVEKMIDGANEIFGAEGIPLLLKTEKNSK